MYFATKVVLYTQIIPNNKVSTQQSNLLYYKTTKWKLSSVYVRAVQGGGFKTHCVSTRRFESCCTHTKKLHCIIKYQKAPLTQLVEWWSYEPQVVGSNPTWSNPACMSERSKEVDLRPTVLALAGSNPAARILKNYIV